MPTVVLADVARSPSRFARRGGKAREDNARTDRARVPDDPDHRSIAGSSPSCFYEGPAWEAATRVAASSMSSTHTVSSSLMHFCPPCSMAATRLS